MTQHTDDVSAAVERAFSAMDSGTSVDQVIGRGRRLRDRRHKLAGSLVAVAAIAALAVPLSQTMASKPQGPTAQTATAPASSRAKAPGVQVDLAAFSVNTNANGTVSITVRQMNDPAALRKTLAKAGIPAIVQVGQFPPPICGSQATGYQQVSAPGVLVAMNSGASAARGKASVGPGVTIRPSAIPKGATVNFAIMMKGTHPFEIVIAVGKGTPPDCAS
jgi:hypothetical protein